MCDHRLGNRAQGISRVRPRRGNRAAGCARRQRKVDPASLGVVIHAQRQRQDQIVQDRIRSGQRGGTTQAGVAIMAGATEPHLARVSADLPRSYFVLVPRSQAPMNSVAGQCQGDLGDVGNPSRIPSPCSSSEGWSAERIGVRAMEERRIHERIEKWIARRIGSRRPVSISPAVRAVGRYKSCTYDIPVGRHPCFSQPTASEARVRWRKLSC